LVLQETQPANNNAHAATALINRWERPSIFFTLYI
jgi:hypothetical protein